MQPVRYLGRNAAGKKPWVTKDVLDLCDERRDLKKRYEAEGAKQYREANRRTQKAVKKAKEDSMMMMMMMMSLSLTTRQPNGSFASRRFYLLTSKNS